MGRFGSDENHISEQWALWFESKEEYYTTPELSKDGFDEENIKHDGLIISKFCLSHYHYVTILFSLVYHWDKPLTIFTIYK